MQMKPLLAMNAMNVLSVALVASAGGIDDAAPTLAGIEAQRAAVAAAAPSERGAVVEQLLHRRAAMIDDHPNDPRRAAWLADQAQDLLFLAVPIDSSVLITRFGLPTAGQRARAGRAARDINEFATAAELALEQAILDSESGRDRTRDDPPGNGLGAALLDTERNLRIPFLRGVGACLHADFNVSDPASRRALYGVALSRLEPLAGRLAGGVAVTARLYTGLAQLGTEQFDAAAATLDAVALDPAARPVEIFTARMGLVRCRAARETVEAGLHALDEVLSRYTAAEDLLFRVLIADERFRLMRRRAGEAAAGPVRQGLLVEAYGAYLDLAGGEEAAFAPAMSRLILVAEGDTPLESLPGLVAVARAGHLALAAGGRTEAIELYERLLKSGRLDDTATATAIFGLARTHVSAENHPAAIRHLLRLAQDHPACAYAEPSIELAATLAAELNRQAPGNVAHRALLRQVLQVLLDRYPNLARVDRWRYRAGCLALDESRFEAAVDFFETVAPAATDGAAAQYRRAQVLLAWTASVTDPARRTSLALRLIDAVAAAGTVAPANRSALALFRAEALLALDDPAGALAALPADDDDPDLATLRVRISVYQALGRRQEMTRQLDRLLDTPGQRAGPVLAAMMEQRQRSVLALIEQDRVDLATAQARRELLPLAEAADRWLREHDPNDTLQLAVADAYRLAGQPADGLRLYDELLVDHADALEILFGRAECLFALADGRLDQAMDLYRRLAFATATARNAHFWQSQLRMVQILKRTGRHTQRIAPYVQQLRGRDPELGGDRFRREFERLQREHQ